MTLSKRSLLKWPFDPSLRASFAISLQIRWRSNRHNEGWGNLSLEYKNHNLSGWNGDWVAKVVQKIHWLERQVWTSLCEWACNVAREWAAVINLRNFAFRICAKVDRVAICGFLPNLFFLTQLGFFKTEFGENLTSKQMKPFVVDITFSLWQILLHWNRCCCCFFLFFLVRDHSFCFWESLVWGSSSNWSGNTWSGRSAHAEGRTNRDKCKCFEFVAAFKRKKTVAGSV